MRVVGLRWEVVGVFILLHLLIDGVDWVGNEKVKLMSPICARLRLNPFTTTSFPTPYYRLCLCV